MSGQAEFFVATGALLGAVFLLSLTLIAGAVYRGLAERMARRQSPLATLDEGTPTPEEDGPSP